MLKSKLIVSEDLQLLNSHLKHYSARFITPLFSDEHAPDRDGYQAERKKLLNFVNTNQQGVRDKIIPQMLSDNDFFSRLTKFFENKDIDIDITLVSGAIKQMARVKDTIEKCCTAAVMNGKLLNEYYEESLNLMVYFSALRSHVVTLKNISEKFGLQETACILFFMNEKETSFSLSQQTLMIAFIEKVFTCFFEEYLDIITAGIDTGSPVMECPIKLNLEVKVNWDITKTFSDLFKHIFDGNKAESIRTIKRIKEQLNENQKQDVENLRALKDDLTQEEYEKYLLEIFDSYHILRKNQIQVAIDNTSIIKRLQGSAPLLIEEAPAAT